MEPEASDDEQEEEEIEIAIGDLSSDDDDEGQDVNIYETRFKDQQPGDFDKKIACVEQKKWATDTWTDDVLKDVAYQIPGTTAPSDRDGLKTPVARLEDLQVKERVARQWEAVNKDSVEKGNHIKSE
jgi:hypothetical protein